MLKNFLIFIFSVHATLALAIEETSINKNINVRGFFAQADDIIYGNAESKIVFLEYFSPTCPHCVDFRNKIFPKIKEKYIDTGKILYILREFIGNKQDLDAAILARCDGNIKSGKVSL